MLCSMPNVELREVTAETLPQVLGLQVDRSQRPLVASNAVSIAQAYFDREAWFRAIYADDVPVGFVLLKDHADEGWTYVWRLMIDAGQQRKGYGLAAMKLIIERARAIPGVERIVLSHGEFAGHAGPFYRRLGFVETGERDGPEVVMVLSLA